MPDTDPERLLTDALRAQAAHAPGEPVYGYALLSGGDLPLGPPAEPVTERVVEQPPKAWWVLLIALTMGLATGAVVGLATLL